MEWKRQTHSKPYPLAHDRSFQKNRVTIPLTVAGVNFVRQLVNTGIIPALISQPCDLRKHLSPDVDNGRIDFFHKNTPLAAENKIHKVNFGSCCALYSVFKIYVYLDGKRLVISRDGIGIIVTIFVNGEIVHRFCDGIGL